MPRTYSFTHGKQCKITRDIANQIRHEYNTSAATQTFLAKKFGITQQQVSLILKNKTWKTE